MQDMNIPHSTFPAGQSGRHIPHSSRRGQATLGFVFLVAAIIILVSISFVFVVVSLINSGYAYQSAQQASFAANSGVEDALLHISRDKDFDSSGYSFQVGASSVTVSVASNTPALGEKSIIARAISGTNSRRVLAIVTVPTSTTALNILSWSEITQ